MDISNNIKDYLNDRSPIKRYASFDYCYNYFRYFYEHNNIEAIANPTTVQLSCLQLGFYLASWGMLRGSSFLLQKSVKHYEQLISAIAKMPKVCWEIDLNTYSDVSISLLLEIYKHIFSSLGENDEYASATLITKIMLGVFGNVPALDDNFCKGFGCGKHFSKSLLQKISEFYNANKEEVDKHKIKTIDFSTGTETTRYYTKAKLIDMVGFIEGIRKSRKQL
ncbi:MAG TPA: hypothetical protein DHV16_02780 [Nitrospiraceae bacterium]|nr:MAG: hypothetical protein A2Z82_01395 [Nitrospirae bacterium GWA2_46_11]OGW26122.1 MAG: hypothetical protein A2X55_03635 [Nitrospirae bacterium GWB2_47_37]HAK89421.1 hypothetical protein [Nitrospiraceae bacterium]HCZ11186.1 hypothetical protein [Nitrospiraceae bacterium]